MVNTDLCDVQLPSTLLCDLYEGIAGHIRHALVRLVHELEQLGDDRLEEAPVSAEEPRVLAHHVHDVARHDSLVVLASLVLAQPQQVPDHHNEERALRVFLHCP